MVAMGAYIGATRVMPLEIVEGALHHVFPKANLIPGNVKALRAGYERAA
jgi:Pyruvate/2-oxoacid:ferredoxin oxidoreductase gamma subunit